MKRRKSACSIIKCGIVRIKEITLLNGMRNDPLENNKSQNPICTFCGKLGHKETSCYLLHPCQKCGGQHNREKCYKELLKDCAFNSRLEPQKSIRIGCVFGKSNRMRTIEKRISESLNIHVYKKSV